MSNKEITIDIIYRLPEDILEEYKKLDRRVDETLSRIRRKQRILK